MFSHPRHAHLPPRAKPLASAHGHRNRHHRDELLLGYTIDTNAAFLARELATLGVQIVRRATVGDAPETITTAIREALDRTGAVITTGGLGPTADDRTKPAIAEIFGRSMVMDEEILAALEQRWHKRFGVNMPASNRQQAMVPEGATISPTVTVRLPASGWKMTASAGWPCSPASRAKCVAWWPTTLIPRLRDRIPLGGGVVRSRTIRTASISESAIADRLGELGRGVDGLPLAFLPGVEGVDLRLTSKGLPAADTEKTTA